ncbi:MAG: FAD/NAD(P)-binding oxidoreductase, partial [Massilia sp.]
MSLPIVILGAGPAGLAAAEAASADGQPVLLVDENPEAGGQIWRGGPSRWHDQRAEKLWKALLARPHVKVLCGARVVAAAAPGTLLLETDAGARSVAWERVILCTGARELLLPFPGWTLPGVTGAGGMQALIKGGMPVAGKRVVVAGSGPLLLAVADTVRRNGGKVVAIAEQRVSAQLARFGARLALRHHAKFMQALHLMVALRSIPYLRGALVTAAQGEDQLASVTLEQGGSTRTIACDFLAC